MLVAIGRRPVTAGLNLEAIGVELDKRGRIIVDDQYNTTCKGVKCIGDVTFGPMLAHKAEEEGIAAVEVIARGHGHVNYQAIPAVVYTHPEVAWVGKNEQELKDEGVEYKIGKVRPCPLNLPFVQCSWRSLLTQNDMFAFCDSFLSLQTPEQRPTKMRRVWSSSWLRRPPIACSAFTSWAPTPVR